MSWRDNHFLLFLYEKIFHLGNQKNQEYWGKIIRLSHPRLCGFEVSMWGLEMHIVGFAFVH